MANSSTPLQFFPLHGIFPNSLGKPVCGCGSYGCSRVGKHPLTRWREPNDSWGTVGPSGGVGIPTGRTNGIFVIDLDVKHNGIEAFDELGETPDTLTVETGTGGIHLYFRSPDFPVKTTAGQIAPGIDVRGEGGFVCGPGSPHASGGSYRLLVDLPPAEAPAWLLDLLRATPAAAPKSVRPSTALSEEELSRRKEYAIDFLRKAPPAIQGGDATGTTGSDRLFFVACRLVKIELPLDVAKDLIDEYYNHRCSPPWTHKEIEHKLDDADRIVDERGFPSEEFIKEITGRVSPRPKRRLPDPDHVYIDDCSRPDQETHPITHGNILADLLTHKDWDGVLQFDDLRKEIRAVNPPMRLDAEVQTMSDEDYIRIRHWFEVKGHKAAKSDIVDAISVVAKRHKYNPVVEYLDALPPSSGVLDQFALRAFGTNDPMSQRCLVKALIAAVRRVRKPGEKVDTVIVLQGKQGWRKSSFLQCLFGAEYVKSQMPRLDTKDASLGLRGFWAVELAEIDHLLLKNDDSAKEFLTRDTDSYRAPYARVEQRFPRQCTFWGTTNSLSFLEDVTGNRRYWIIRVDRCDIAWVSANRDALWREASDLEAAGVPHWFEDEEEVLEMQRPFEVLDDWEVSIREWLAGKKRFRNALEVWTDCLAKGNASAIEKFDRKTQKRIVDILTHKIRCVSRRSAAERWYDVPEDVTNADVSESEALRRKAQGAVTALKKLVGT